MELSIVMPCLNEARTLPVCIDKALRFLRESGVEGEIIVADNGSDDGSVEIAERKGARVVPVPRKGYGAALSEGIHAARGEFVIMGDSDDSYDFLALQPFVDKLREGYDLVMGNRFQGGISPGAMPFLHRFLGNPLLSALGRRIYEHEICHDFYCGLRGFRKSAIQGLHLQSSGMEFALEMVLKATLYHLKIAEVPTTLSPDGRDRRPHLRTFQDGWKSLRLYLLMSPRWTFGLPGLALLVMGASSLLVSLLNILPEWAELGALVIGMLGLVLGYQAVQLAIFAKFVAIETGLHPPLTKFWVLREPGTLERFLLAGVVLVGLSIAAAIGSTVQAVTGFLPMIGHLSPTELAILSALFFILAGQTILGGFYFGILEMMTQRRQFPRKRREDIADGAGEEKGAVG